MKKLQLPFGVQDFMPDECYNKKLTEERLAEVFAAHGFLRISTPAIEYFDVYGEILSSVAVNKTFKMTDSDGRLLMLRSDPTFQICRLAATKLKTENISKVYYTENSYEYISDSTTARSREFPQAGVELLGAAGIDADIETVIVAIESLKTAGLEDFILEIGQVDYFNGIAYESGLGETDSKELRLLINKKDMLGVEMFLQGKNIDNRFVAQFLKMPSLFGDSEVLNSARKGVSNSKSNLALDNLDKIITAVSSAGYEKYITVDLGLLRGDYYTGLVIKGLSGNLGVPILDGGRYDSLCKAFGENLPAVGFSIGVKRLLIALEKEGKLSKRSVPDCVYISDGKDYAYEYEYVSKLRNRGKTVEKCFFSSKEELCKYCDECGIECAFVICGNTVAFKKGGV